jgi:predicted molibdopterin-dependent oxidoreductase YjgC
LIRKDGSLQEVEWNEALSFVANGLTGIKNASGASSLAALGSERLTNEEAYVFNRFVRTVMETPHLDHAGGVGYRALIDGLRPSLGYPAGTNSIREIRNSQVIVLIGADLTETHPVAKNEVINATARNRARVIVIDSIRTKLTDRPGLYLLAPPGSEHLLANAMLKWIVDQGLFDRTALNLRVEGLDDLIASLSDYTPERVAELTGVDAALIREAAEEYAKAASATIVLTQGMNQIGHNVEVARAATNLALITGRIGKESCGLHLLGEKANSQGAIDMGLTPELLPGFHSIADEAARAKFEAAWQAQLPQGTGLGAAQILAKAESGEIRGLYVVGENPLETYPDRMQVERALSRLDFFVVQDLFTTSTAKMAHAVLPVVSFAEKVGTYTSADRFVQRLRPALKTTGGKSDLEIFTALAALMGKPSMTYAGPEQVMEEIAGLVDVYGGISYDRLVDKGIHWPCMDEEDCGKKLLYEGGFPAGKARLTPAPQIQEPLADEFPMYLVPGVLKFHSGSLSQWSAAMMEVCPDAEAEISRQDLKALGLKAGDTVKITNADGISIQVRVRPSRRALEGSIIVPPHFPALELNRVTRWGQSVLKVKVEKVAS